MKERQSQTTLVTLLSFSVAPTEENRTIPSPGEDLQQLELTGGATNAVLEHPPSIHEVPRYNPCKPPNNKTRSRKQLSHF